MSDDGTPAGPADALSLVERSDGQGFSIVDHTNRRRCHVRTDDSITLTECEADGYAAPIDRAVAIETGAITLPHTMAVYVRDSSGRLLETIPNGTTRRFPEVRHQIELTTPIKLYLFFTGSVEVEATPDTVSLAFERPTRVTLGMRAPHLSPQTTVRTTTDPSDLAAAITQFGSALKTTTCERSYPTLRGHPPAVEQADTLSIPDSLDPPDTGVTIRVRPQLAQLYAVSTLAYYLGAEVRIGGPARLVTDTGYEHPLESSSRGLEAEVDRVLQQCFFLDCLTRTEGLYPFELHDRQAIEGQLGLDFETVYERPLSAQLERYLAIPFDVVEPHVPRWQFAAHVQPSAGYLEALPYIAYDLSTIRTAQAPASDAGSPRRATDLGIEEFLRRDGTTGGGEPCAVDVDSTDALADVWFAPGIPVGASKGSVQAYRNRIARSPSSGSIEIRVVINDSNMTEEGQLANDVYGTREDLPFDVEVLRHETKDGLAQVLSTGADFLHYIGHIDDRGFDCADGWLDADAIDDTNVDSFLLNACDSYQQGMKLLDAGSIAGVVTTSPVSNAEARVVGERLAKLLHLGFPFYAAVDVATTDRDQSFYKVVGDSGMNITQIEGGVGALCDVEKVDSAYRISYFTYPTRKYSIGTVSTRKMKENSIYYLASGTLFEDNFSKKEAHRFLSLSDVPMLYGSELHWSHDFVDDYISDSTDPNI